MPIIDQNPNFGYRQVCKVCAEESMYVQSAQGQEDDAYATAKNPLEVEVTTTGNVNQSYLILIRMVVKHY